MRVFLFLAAALVLPAQAETAIPCEGRATGNGSGELVCAVEPGAATGLQTLSARFSGVHDDSQAGLAASVDGAPLACTGDSRTNIAGEQDGDTLVCRFTLPAGALAVRRIKVHLLWFHAEPAAFKLTGEQAAQLRSDR